MHPADLSTPDHAGVELQPLRVAVAVPVQQRHVRSAVVRVERKQIHHLLPR